ncbi:unnamed protein product [Prunus brigantina]
MTWNWKAQTEIPTAVTNTQDQSKIEIDSSLHEVTEVDNNCASPCSSSQAEEQERNIHATAEITKPYDHTPVKWRSINNILPQCSLCIVEPEKYEEATQDQSWIKAMEDELSMIEKNETWELVNRPSDKQVNGVKWVFKTKLNLDGSVQKNKARLGWKLYQLDVKSAFLNGKLQEEVYVEQPEGFVVQGKEDRVYRLHKAFYWLKQAPRAWYGEIDSYFAECGFEKSLSKATLYTKTRGENDILIPVSTPLVATEKLIKDDGSSTADEENYRKLVGSLLYLTVTRLDVIYAASLLARYMHGPSNKHYGTAKRVLNDWGCSIEDSKSTSGYAFSFGSGVFSWAYVIQNCVALSTAEVEYVSVSEATTQAIWLRFVLEDFGELQADATPLKCDNASANSITKNLVFHQRTKHIDRRYHFIKDALQQGIIDLIYCPTKDQVADIFTKSLPKERFNYLRDKLGVVSVQSLKGSVSV